MKRVIAILMVFFITFSTYASKRIETEDITFTGSITFSNGIWIGGAIPEAENNYFGFLSGSNKTSYGGSFKGYNDNGMEWYFQNTSASPLAYGEENIYPDNDNNHQNYFARGVNSSTYTNRTVVGFTNDCYFYSKNLKNLLMGVGDTAQYLLLWAGGLDPYTNWQIQVTSSGANVRAYNPTSNNSNQIPSYYTLDTEFNGTTQSTLTASIWTNYVYAPINMCTYNITRGRAYVNQTNALTGGNLDAPVTFNIYDGSTSSNDSSIVYQSIFGMTCTLATNRTGIAAGSTNILVNNNANLYVGSLLYVMPSGTETGEFVRVKALPTTNNIVFNSATLYNHIASNGISRVREFSTMVSDSSRGYQLFYSLMATNSAPATIGVYSEYTK